MFVFETIKALGGEKLLEIPRYDLIVMLAWVLFLLACLFLAEKIKNVWVKAAILGFVVFDTIILVSISFVAIPGGQTYQ